MKRTFTQKAESIPSCETDNDALEKLSLGKLPGGVAGSIKPVTPEVSRRARTSAAMIGLAISMGASSLLLHQQSDEAMAAEPVVTEPSPTTNPAATEKAAVTVPILKMKPETTAISSLTTGTVVTPASIVVEEKAIPKQPLWQVPQKEQVEGVAIAAKETQSVANLPTGQVISVNSVNVAVPEIKADATLKTKSRGIVPVQLQPNLNPGGTASGSLLVSESTTIPGNVNSLFKAKQDAAVNNLKSQRERLQTSLAELRSEESPNKALQTEELSSSAISEQQETPNLEIDAAEPIVIAPKKDVSLPIAVINPTEPVKPGFISPVLGAKKAPIATNGVLNQVPSLPAPALETPVADAPKTVVVPTTERVLASIKTSAKSINKIDLQTPVVNEPSPIAPGSTYHVKPGDTLAAIARSYGVSAADLGQLNQIENPNLIRVHQSLKIPQLQSTTIVASLDPTIGSSTPIVTPEVETPSVAVPTLPTGITTPEVATPKIAAPTLATGITSPEVATPKIAAPTLAKGINSPAAKLPVIASTAPTIKAATESTTIATPIAQPAVLVASEASQTTASNPSIKSNNANPYVDKLRLEIVKLREQYRDQREGVQVSGSTEVTVPSIPIQITVPPVNNNLRPSGNVINPEFSPKRYQETLRNDNQRQPRQIVQDGPIPIRVEGPPPGSYRQQAIVASAPASTDTYNPSIQIPVGQPVSPELPSSSPDSDPYSFKGFVWPSKGVLTSGYGWRWGRMHKGIDIAAPIGTPIIAAAPGVVTYARWNSGGYGMLVDIQHPDGSVTRYGHNSRILVREGQMVAQGEQIAEMGSTGYSTGPHCHFEIHTAGKGAVNPMAFLPSRNASRRG